jgi:PKD repeat protein
VCQETSNKGTLFWVGFMDHIDGTGADMDLYITSDSSTTGTVSIPGQSWSVNFSVTADSMTLVSVPSDKAYMSCSDCIEDKGIKVTSVKPIVVYSHIHHSARSDATLVLPAESTGQEYFVMSYTQAVSGQNSQFMIIASQDNTKVKITPTDNVAGKSANIAYFITLDAGEVYQGQAPNRSNDLTGTKIEVIDTGANANCRKVSVFSGSSFTSLGCSGSGDNLYQQLYPTSSWSNTFATVPFKSRNFDRFRILASKDNTVIIIDGQYVTTINSGQFHETGNVNKPQYILGSKPISVAQFQVTQACGGIGDPSMTILSPVQQTLKDITVYSSEYENITSNYINVVILATDTSTFTIDNKKAKFSIISSLPAYAYAQIDVASGNHHLKASQGFVAIAYGFGVVESYGYSAGANVTNLSQYIQLDNSKVSNINTICLGETAEFVGNANFAVAKWEWKFGDDSTSSIQSPNHIYKDTGQYIVKMFTTKPSFDGCSLKDSAEIIIKVVNYPKVSFGFDNSCLKDTVNFLDTVSTDMPGVIGFTLWDYGDGKKEFINNPSHIYDSAGRYGVEVLVKNSFECYTSVKDTIEIYPTPKAEFFASGACYKDSTMLQDSSISFPHTIIEWTWNMGEGSIDTTFTNRHAFLYDTSGIFDIQLTIKTDKGCTATSDSVFTKHAQFVAAFSSKDECLKNVVELVDTSNTSGVNPTYRLWGFGDGDTSTDKNPLHNYSADGNYAIKLIIRQNAECMDSIEKPIAIYKQVIPRFSIQNLCFKDSAILMASHLPILEVVDDYEWLHNGNTYIGQKWTHQFSDTGKNNFSLITTTSNGCIDTLDTFAMINPKPVADFTSDIACERSNIALTNNSKDFGAKLIKLEWSSTTASSFGNPDTFKYLLNSSLFESV